VKPVLPIPFEDEVAQLQREGAEFQRLSDDEKWRQIAELARIGEQLLAASPHRAAIERQVAQEEAAWQEAMRRVMRRYGVS